MNPVSILPRFIKIRGDNGRYLAVNQNGQLLFDASLDNLPSDSPIPRLATHEVLFNADDNSFIIRSQNSRFWTRSSSADVNATLQQPPSATNSVNRFKVEQLGPNVLALKSALDDRYFKRFNDGRVNFYRALVTTPDAYTRVEITSSQENAINLPRHITFRGDNDKFMLLHVERNLNWLKFHGDDTGGWLGTNEVIPLLDGKLAFRSLRTNLLWRSSGAWVWADAPDSEISKSECKFQPIRLSSSMIALRCEWDNRLAKRYTDFWQSCLATISNVNLRDVTAHFRIAEAVSRRSVFNVRYLLSLADTSDQRPVLVGQGSARNNTNLMVDLEVQVVISQRVSTSQNFSNSFTFSQSISTTFRAGIPLIARAEIGIEIGFEQSFSQEWGETKEEAVEFVTRYLVKDVPPGQTASVRVECTVAKLRIPFTYQSQETNLTGVDKPIESFHDGIYEGVSAYNIHAEINNSTTTEVVSAQVP